MTQSEEANLDDRRLMRNVRNGDRAAQQRLMSRLYRRVHRLARYLARSDVEADDLTHEALLEILDAAGSYRAEGSIEAWADVIAVRRIRRKLKRSRRFAWLLGGDPEEHPEPASPSPDPEQQTRQRARQDRLTALLRSLSRDQRLVLVLKLHYGYTAQEVAQLSGLSLKTVQYEIKRGRARLRQRVLRDDQLQELLSKVTS
jgi:RNA polymerase sigma-70 factor (ECF subfamily)